MPVGLGRRTVLSWLSAPLLARVPGAAAAPRVSLAGFGLIPGAADAEPAFRAAIERLPRSGGTIVVPPGIWRFRRTEGAAVPISGRDNVVIEGHGATLLFQGVARPFVFDGCVAPVVRGLTIDWQRPPFSQGEVIAAGAHGRSADIRIESAFPVDGSEPVEAFQTMEPGTMLMARRGLDIFAGGIGKSELIGAQTLRLSLTRPIALRAGDSIVLRHKTYQAPIFDYARCRDILVEDVALRAGPGMGIVAIGCDGGTVRRLTIAPPPDSSRQMTLTADGVHFAACRGEIVIEDCLMRGMADDGVNVHGKYYVIQEVVDRRALRVAAPPGTRFGALPASPAGDVFELASRDYASLGQATLARARDGSGDMILEFESDLPLGLTAGELVRDVETNTKTHISGCHFPGNRARGVLAHADTLIEKCVFTGQSMSAVLLAVEPYFLEGPVIRGVDVSGNAISDVSRGEATADITVEALAPRTGSYIPDPVRVNSDVNLSRNTISSSSLVTMSAASVERVNIADNHVTNARQTQIAFTNCDGLTLSGNTFVPGAMLSITGPEPKILSLRNNVRLQRGA